MKNLANIAAPILISILAGCEQPEPKPTVLLEKSDEMFEEKAAPVLREDLADSMRIDLELETIKQK